MFGSLLIANRGEIARRIIRTARRMGVRTIAVFSDADAGLPFVREADAALHIGPAPAQDSYLRAEKILEAARASGADAIHPGYGFLSENAAFAESVAAGGLAWVGAPAHAIRAMGLKDAAKALMEKAGVAVTPGYLGADQGEARLKREADAIGYPVLIKAVAGGGGKGMRKVDAAGDFLDALRACRREAEAAFGDGNVLIEKYVSAPRHIEVQVFADTHGNVVHLFERDCSLQRRHQKVIEEAPAPGMDEKTRARLCAAAVKAARAVDYVGAGTIEFIADASGALDADRIWFMEMNTRLQVEHPVTEAITGLDLVEWQLRVAAGERLPLTQNEIAIRGWAMEARLYAENPASGFLPSTGPLTHLRLPSGVRVDSGVEEGDAVTPHYDPMIAKIIAHGATRKAAAAALADACAGVEVWPVKTNARFLAAAARDPDFVAGAVDTGFIARKGAALIGADAPSEAMLQAGARALIGAPGRDPWEALHGFRSAGPKERRVALEANGAPFVVTLDEIQVRATARRIGDAIVVFDGGQGVEIAAPSADHASGAAGAGDGAILAPMPGRILSVDVAADARVSRGDRLMILEAMKMEHALIAPFDGVVAHMSARVGDQVSEGALLARIEAAP